jgi:hypothetical protein
VADDQAIVFFECKEREDLTDGTDTLVHMPSIQQRPSVKAQYGLSMTATIA